MKKDIIGNDHRPLLGARAVGFRVINPQRKALKQGKGSLKKRKEG